MIKGFAEETSPLNDYELRTLLPVILEGLKNKQGKRNAVTRRARRSAFICIFQSLHVVKRLASAIDP